MPEDYLFDAGGTLTMEKPKVMKFTPKADITAYELAVILAKAYLVAQEPLEPELQRHFTLEEV